ncbi:Antitoxin component of toxin-antitoxin stability system, DNA-binding transcriptional repressor [Candidatus Electronema halotolerans]|jgi:prevent-host-death family protein
MLETVSKSRFKAKALEYFRQVEQQRKPLIITDHGRPVLQITPFEEQPQAVLEELRGSVLRYDDPLEPVGIADWDALQ